MTGQHSIVCAFLINLDWLPKQIKYPKYGPYQRVLVICRRQRTLLFSISCSFFFVIFSCLKYFFVRFIHSFVVRYLHLSHLYNNYMYLWLHIMIQHQHFLVFFFFWSFCENDTRLMLSNRDTNDISWRWCRVGPSHLIYGCEVTTVAWPAVIRPTAWLTLRDTLKFLENYAYIEFCSMWIFNPISRRNYREQD